MKTHKVCKKGIGKALGFEGCGEELEKVKYNKTNFRYGLGISCGCFSKWLRSSAEGLAMLDKAMNIGKEKVIKEKKREFKQKKESVTNYSELLQKKINQIIRFIDREEPCLAKGIYSRQVHAGHIFSRGSNPTIRFNLHNIHRQSAQSNHFQNEDGLLREGLMQEYGLDYYNFVSELRRTPRLEYSNEQYKDIYKLACKLYNELVKSDETFTKVKERIEVRNVINAELSIYDKEYCIFKKH